MAKPTVSTAIAAVHACGGAALRANAVTEVGTIRNDPPNSTADAYAADRVAISTGRIAPSITTAFASATPRPPDSRASNGPHASPAPVAATPAQAQKRVTSSAPKARRLRR
jgi:hypothetical protein